MQNELLTEHLGFAPVHFVDQVLEIVNRITYKCLSQLETVLQTELGALECEKVALPKLGNGSNRDPV